MNGRTVVEASTVHELIEASHRIVGDDPFVLDGVTTIRFSVDAQDRVTILSELRPGDTVEEQLREASDNLTPLDFVTPDAPTWATVEGQGWTWLLMTFSDSASARLVPLGASERCFYLSAETDKKRNCPGEMAEAPAPVCPPTPWSLPPYRPRCREGRGRRALDAVPRQRAGP